MRCLACTGTWEIMQGAEVSCVAYTVAWEIWQGAGSEMCSIYRDMGYMAGTVM